MPSMPRAKVAANSLAVFFPELALEWDFDRNESLRPEDVLPGSKKLVWWRCCINPEHRWQRKICVRTKGSGCPVCLKPKVQAAQSLAVLRPKVAAEWHPSLNGQLQPSHVPINSYRKVWWVCSKNRTHQWRACVVDRASARKTGGYSAACPYCRGYRASRERSLAAVRPDLAAEWHPTKNRRLWTKSGGTLQIREKLRLKDDPVKSTRRLRPTDLLPNSAAGRPAVIAEA